MKQGDKALLTYIKRLNSSRIKAGFVHAELAEHSWINETQFATRSESGHKVGVLSDFHVWFANNHATGHPKMDHPLRRQGSYLGCFPFRSTPASQPTLLSVFPVTKLRGRYFSLQIKDDVFPCSVHALDPGTLQRSGNQRRGRFERLRARTDPDRFDGVAGDAPSQTAHYGFYFREFRHVIRIQDQNDLKIASPGFAPPPPDSVS